MTSIAQQVVAKVSIAALVLVSQTIEEVTRDDTVLATSAAPAPAE